MEKDIFTTCQCADFFDGVERANFIVGEHKGDQNRIRANGLFHLLDGDQAITARHQVSDFKSLALQRAARIDDSFVLDFRRDDVLTALFIKMRNALDGEVVRFGSTRCKNDFFARSADQRTNLIASNLYSLFSLPTETVAAAGCITKDRRQIGHHRIEYPRIERCGCMVVEVNRCFDHISIL